MSFLNIADLAEAESFRRRMYPAIAKVAGQVLVEEPTGASMRDGKRNELARQALRDPITLASAFVWACLSNAVIAEKGLDATDSELEYQISQTWSTIAGVTATDEEVTPVPEVPEVP